MTTAAPPSLRVFDLGRMAYAPAYEEQCRHVAEVLAAREAGNPEAGRLLLVEHDPPVITVSRRPHARRHLIAGEAMLQRAGVEVAQTDRGGDITYHGPGQLVAYPILDLNHLRLGLHDYMRLIEQCAIDVCAAFGVDADREKGCTGVWVRRKAPGHHGIEASGDSGNEKEHQADVAQPPPTKICAIGVRIRRWVSMHGLALNVTTNLDHFGLIVPCGLVGRTVTSLRHELGPACPSMPAAKRSLAGAIEARLTALRV